jgi:hypothetical protein
MMEALTPFQGSVAFKQLSFRSPPGYPACSTYRTPADSADKVFHLVRAAFALHGHTLHPTNPNDGTVAYWAERWGLVRYLPTIDTARRFLEQIGGRL